ncbi:hypothetical protein K4K55_000944 [Colletotrichum sp. SAR 10_96]|nr:hypothetical protein K4K55_000944 [Colletotrichum sp. SAR 10_96]
MDKMQNITVNGNTLIHEETTHVPRTAEDTDFILVQGRGRDFDANEKQELKQLKVEILEYVAEHTYLCRYLPKNLEPLRAKLYVQNVTILTVHKDKIQGLVKLDNINRIEHVQPEELFNDQARGTLKADSLALSTSHPELGDIRLRGTAPSAKLMVQSIAYKGPKNTDFKLKTPLDLTANLFSKAYEAGVRIHSNSWSKAWNEETGQGDYEGQATEIDKFVYSHQDFVVLVAAGNHANLPKTKRPKNSNHIGAASAAKNCITVGATGSTRNNDGWSFMNGPDDVPRTRVNDTAIFSSRGPTKSSRDKDNNEVAGRIKPDIVAPGVAILSAASRALDTKDRARTKYGPSADTDWLFMSGTSMSTPLVAGCVALLREALEGHGKSDSSAALIKALLVNSAVNFSERLGPGIGYDYEQGFGRVNIDGSIATIHCSSFFDGVNGLMATAFDVPALRQVPESESRWASAEIPLPRGRNSLVVTLAYPDSNGTLLQNDLNLIVLSGGAERHGNMGKNTGFDHINNVEKIIWDNVPGETFKIIVRIFNNLKPELMAAFAVAWDIRPLAKF